jgi:hypothetical protein
MLVTAPVPGAGASFRGSPPGAAPPDVTRDARRDARHRHPDPDPERSGPAVAVVSGGRAISWIAAGVVPALRLPPCSAASATLGGRLSSCS